MPRVEPVVGAIARGPYLQHSDAGTRVVWYTTGEPPGDGRVRWSSGERAGEAVARGTALSSATRQEAEITPLSAGSRYSYRVYSSRGLLSVNGGTVDFSFRTADEDVFRLVVFGDSGKGTPEQSAVAQAIAGEAAPPDMVMIVGDVIYPPADDASYDARFFTPYRNLLPSIPFYAVPGNHDYEVEAGKPFFDIFTLPANGPAGLPPESTYALSRGGTQLVGLDTNQPLGLLRSLTVPWHTAVTRKPATFRLVFQHHALYSSGPNSLLAESTALRNLLAPVFASTGVDLVFNGHDHFYERTTPLGGVVYVTTGAGGAELYPRLAKNGFTAAFFNERHSYTAVEISGRTLRLRQTDLNGQTVDTLSITKAVAAADRLRAFAGAGSPAAGWDAPGFDDSGWPEQDVQRFAAPLRARRRFGPVRAADVSEAILRVAGASDYVVRLNGVEVARGGRGGPGVEAFAVSRSLLRDSGNALALEGQLLGDEAEPPSLELSLFSREPAPR